MHNILSILLFTAVCAIKLGQGFDLNIFETFNKNNVLMITKGVITTVFLMPVFILVIIYLFHPTLPVLIALIVMSVCPPADLSIQQVTKLGGNVPLSAGILSISTLLSVFTIPLILKLFEKILGLHVNFDLLELIREIFLSILLPLMIGMVLRMIFPKYTWLAKYISHIAFLLLVAVVLALIIQNYSGFKEITFDMYRMLIVAVMGAYILGIFMSGRKTSQQITLGIETGLRNPGIAVILANHNFAPEHIMRITVPYVFTSIVLVIFSTVILKLMHKYYLNERT